MVRAKFQLQEIRTHCWDQPNAPCKTLVFRPMYDQSIPEDKRFAVATPSGEFIMQVTNPTALDQLKLGEYYYVDFSPVSQAVAAS